MRFPLALPLFLLLILNCCPSFDSEAAPSPVVSNFVHGSTGSLNDTRHVFSSEINYANRSYQRYFNAIVSDHKPLPQASTLNQSPENYANMTDTDLDHAIAEAENLTAVYEKNSAEANRTLQAKKDEAVEPYRHYNQTYDEWHRLQAIADQVTTELKTIVNNAKQILSERKELPRLKSSVTQHETEFGPLLDEFERAKSISEDMNNTSANLDQAKRNITRLTPEIPIQTEKVSKLTAIMQAKDEEVTKLQENIRLMEGLLENADCVANKVICDQSNERLNTYKNALIIAEPQLEEARRVENSENAKLTEMSDELARAESTKRRLEPRMRNIDERIKTAAATFDTAQTDKLEAEKPLIEARLKLNETESAIKNAEKDTTVAGEKLAELSRSGVVKEANNAHALFILAKTEKEKFDVEIDELEGKVKEYTKIWHGQQARALALQHERDKRKSAAPQTGSTNMGAIIGITGGIGLLIIAAVIALVVSRRVKAKKRKGKKSKGALSSAATESVAPAATPSSTAQKVPCEEPSPPRAPPVEPPKPVEATKREVGIVELEADPSVSPEAKKFIKEKLAPGSKITIINNKVSGSHIEFPYKDGVGRMVLQPDGWHRKLLIDYNEHTMQGRVDIDIDCSGTNEYEGPNDDGSKLPKNIYLKKEFFKTFIVGTTAPGFKTEGPEERYEAGTDTEYDEEQEETCCISRFFSYFSKKEEPVPAVAYVSRKESGRSKRSRAGQEALEVEKTQPSGTVVEVVEPETPAEEQVAVIPSKRRPAKKGNRKPSRSSFRDERSERSSRKSRKRPSKNKRNRRKSKAQRDRDRRRHKVDLDYEDKREISRHERTSDSTSSDSSRFTETISRMISSFSFVKEKPSLTAEFQDKMIYDMFEALRSKRKIDMEFETLEMIFEASKGTMYKESRLVEVYGDVIVITDIHGQLGLMQDILCSYTGVGKRPAWKHLKIVFLGDYVDRGENSLEVIVLLLLLKERANAFTLIRGNHESALVNCGYGFKTELYRRFSKEHAKTLFDKINAVFHRMPLAAHINKKVLCCHGCIPKGLKRLEEINKIDKVLVDPTTDKFACGLLWNDTMWGLKGFKENTERKIGDFVGEDVIDTFCENTGVDLIVRGHQVMMNGYEWFCGRRLVTIFSAAGYYPDKPNHGASIFFSRDGGVGICKYVNLTEGEPVTDEVNMQIADHHGIWNQTTCYKTHTEIEQHGDYVAAAANQPALDASVTMQGFVPSPEKKRVKRRASSSSGR